jgi:hypothetical protein
MTIRIRSLATALSLLLLAVVAIPASAMQIGAGLHYLRTIDDFGGSDEFSQDDFSIFGTLTIPVLMVQVEGNLEWVPNYIGTDEHLIQPAVYGKIPIGPIYGGAGIGIGYLTGDLAGWATNPFYALRAGIEFGLGDLALDAFAAYRFQSANFFDGASNLDLDALTLAAQIKFGD